MTVATRISTNKNGKMTRSQPQPPARSPVLPSFDPESTVYDPNESYPEVEIGRGLTSQLTWITPAMAGVWAEKVGKIQRNKRKFHMRSLVEDLKAGRFRLNGETVVFDSDGHLIDGQHRLAAIIETGEPILTVVIRNVPPSAYATLGGGAKRMGQDALRSDGYENASRLASAALILRRYERSMIAGMGTHGCTLVLSAVAIEEAVKEHPGLARSVQTTQQAGRTLHAFGAVAFCHYILSGINAGDATTFFEKVATGEELKKGDPILALRGRVREEKNGRDEVIHLTFKCWNAWRKGQNVMILKRGSAEALPRPV